MVSQNIRSPSRDLVNIFRAFGTCEKCQKVVEKCWVLKIYYDIGDFGITLRWPSKCREISKNIEKCRVLSNCVEVAARGGGDLTFDTNFSDCQVVKICDFGISKHLTQTNAKTTVGTAHYMSPEVVEGLFSFLNEHCSSTVCSLTTCKGFFACKPRLNNFDFPMLI